MRNEAVSGFITITVIVLMHLACLSVFWVGFSWAALITCILAYQFRGFGITGAYHRYFAHKSYKTSRWFQFVLGLWGCSALQGTPIEWSKNHRHHHRHSDKEDDIHSPARHGFWWAHMGWMFTLKGHPVTQKVRDLEQFPEIRALQYLQLVPIIALPVLFYLFGEALGSEYHTSGLQMVIWGFCMSTVVLWHCTYSINSLCHIWGKQRFKSYDDSKNSFLFGILSLGEGWHNNHHTFPSSARNGFFWWEVDLTYYVLKLLESLGLIWDLRKPPKEVYEGSSPKYIEPAKKAA